MKKIPVQFAPLKKCDIILFDQLHHQLLLPFLNGRSYTIVNPDCSVYPFSLKSIALVLLHLLHGMKLRVAIIIAAFKIIKPKLVITYVDNSGLFQDIASRYKSARFLAIQNGNRLLARDHVGKNSKIYHDIFLCIGPYEIEQFTAHGAVVNTYQPIGTLINFNYERTLSRHREKKRFKICLISQVRPGLEWRHNERMKGALKLADYLQRYAMEHNLFIVVAMRAHAERNIEHFNWERLWYETHLPAGRLFQNNLDRYTSYRLSDISEITVGMHSTSVRESFGRGNKILSCNYTGAPVYNFPVDGIWSIKGDEGYSNFKDRIDKLLAMKEEDFTNISSKAVGYLYGRPIPNGTGALISHIVDSVLAEC